ncbi:MAG: cytochrome c biogenesis protein CcsA [bacterium]
MDSLLPTLGIVALITALAAFLAAWFVYWRADRGSPNALPRGRTAVVLGSLALLVAGGVLMRLIWTHDYSIQYVYQNVSNDLPTLYVISAFWAGQEGSFLLWAMLAGIVAFALYWRAGRWEAPVMQVYLPQVVVLIVLTLISAPFAVMPQVPADGAGLNPLLRDPWMAIHPPVTFLGYATLAAPFAFAIASLRRSSNNDGWVRHALPWALVGWLALGAGIIMGGFWAYKVLGWGGWWGWDPVENASLLPWLTATALFHGLLLQRTRNKLAKTNIVLAVLTFGLVIYSTFLTRSGVLEGVSVHTFGTSTVGPFLGAWLAGVFVYGFWALFSAREEVAAEAVDEPLFSREVLVLVGIVVLVTMTVMIGLGTSAPIISSLAGRGNAAVDISFYGRVTLPLGILLALGIGLSVLLRWRGTGTVSRNAIIAAAFLGLLGAWGASLMGVEGILYLIFATASVFALAANLVVFERALMKGGWRLAGGYVAHIGVALMLVAVVAATASTTRKVDLPYNTPREVMGSELTFKGWMDEPEGKQSAIVEMREPGSEKVTVLRPKLYQMYGSGQMMVRAEPHIQRRMTGDLYLAPAQYLPPKDAMAGQGDILTLEKGAAEEVGGVRFTFRAFDMSGMDAHGAEDEEQAADMTGASIGARVEVSWAEGSTTVVPRLAVGDRSAGGAAPLPEEVGGQLQLQSLDADNGAVTLLYTDADTPIDGRAVGGLLTVEVSSKPLMNVLWIGVVLVLLGGAISIWRRALQVQPV